MHKLVDQAVAEVGTVLLGKEQQVRLALCCLIAQGHLLIEDLPGMGKTILSNALARVLGLDYQRVQFTSDLLPADVLGVSIFNRQDSSFRFMPGPIFSQLLLADEINRSTPKTQSALLEAMEEGQVSIEGKTRDLPTPFFVIATQNPSSQAGTYPLPESQLDRFLMRISLGYPSRDAERKLLLGDDSRQKLPLLKTCVSKEQLFALQAAVKDIHCSEDLMDYLQRLIAFSRKHNEIACGLSPRGAIALLRCAKAWALMQGRGHVVPEDIQVVLPAVVEHRLQHAAEYRGDTAGLSQRMLAEVAVLNA
ncbi:AAA family ATPase [Dasania marina]|uniref:AAA family ATPase n=1 Tax=Dasania marina TaxID=471499 RepID=UPI0003604896|nr:MoxR family ATPase [Dasania marina]